MKSPSGRRPVQLNTSSMADIAFLLLIFFLVTTTMNMDKGLMIRLPADIDVPITKKTHDRNLFKILINSNDVIMVEDQSDYDISNLKKDLKKFILNYGKEDNLSVSPKEAVISIKTNRGTSYKAYIEILDLAQAAYFDIYGEKTGMSAEDFRKLDLSDPKNQVLYNQVKKEFPMNISIAKPTHD